MRLLLSLAHDQLGLLARVPPKVTRDLLGMHERLPDRRLQLLKLLETLLEDRYLLRHSLVLRKRALELVRDLVQEIVHLVRVVTAEAVLELLAPYVHRSYSHIITP